MKGFPNKLTPIDRATFVHYIASAIILLSAVVLLYILGSYFSGNRNYTSFREAKELLNILLPLIGTWMGTILAFYFSKENFQAANDSVKNLVNQITSTDEKLQVIKASDVMITTEVGALQKVADDAAFKEMTIVALIGILENSQSERLIILQEKTLKFIFLIYLTTLDRFLREYDNGSGSIKLKEVLQSPPAPKKTNAQLTVDDMLQSDFPLIKEILLMKQCFLAPAVTLDKVKQAMQDNSKCQDVIITKTGNPEEAVMGWITNTIIIEKAELFNKAGGRL